jgi:uncharacterized protein (TIGR03435 family)
MHTEQLGWTLVHFLWQGAFIAVFYAAGRRFLASVNGRYLLACVALASMMAAPIVTWWVLEPTDGAPVVAMDRTARAPGVIPSAATLPAGLQAAVPSAQKAPWLQWAVAIWLLGASALSMRLLGSWIVAARLRWRMTRPAPLEWCRVLERLRTRLGVARAVGLRVSAMVQSPVVIGAWRPLVLVPVGMLAGLPAAQVEALLIHELAHIRRHDYLVNLLQSVTEALLFYHPAVWWVSGHIRIARECCCDDAAVAASGDVLEYVSALAELVGIRPAHVAAVAANGGSLADRIARLLGESRPARRNGLARGTVLGVVLLAGAAYGVFAQTEARPEFQVASVKINSENPQRRIVRPQPGGRLMAENAPLQLLIQNAYGVQAYQVVGGPGWVNADGFDVQAKPEGEASTAQMWLMLQSLLADRFKLAVHRETRERPVYALTGAKGSFNPPAQKEDCVATPPGTSPTPGTFPCGRVGILGAPAGIQMNGVKAPMAEFVRMLAMLMGRPVIDQTGFSGELDVRLSFTPDESVQGIPGTGPGAMSEATDPNKPNIFAALQEQMGLKLTSSKGPVEVLVIDRVERPTAN